MMKFLRNNWRTASALAITGVVAVVAGVVAATVPGALPVIATFSLWSWKPLAFLTGMTSGWGAAAFAGVAAAASLTASIFHNVYVKVDGWLDRWLNPKAGRKPYYFNGLDVTSVEAADFVPPSPSSSDVPSPTTVATRRPYSTTAGIPRDSLGSLKTDHFTPLFPPPRKDTDDLDFTASMRPLPSSSPASPQQSGFSFFSSTSASSSSSASAMLDASTSSSLSRPSV